MRAVEKQMLSPSPGLRTPQVKEASNRKCLIKEAFSPRLVALQARSNAKQAALVVSNSEEYVVLYSVTHLR